MEGNIPRQMETSFKIACTIIFFIGASLIILKIADGTGRLSISAVDSVRASGSTSQTLKGMNLNAESNSDIYEPPNYGSPDSQHGSGTR